MASRLASTIGAVMLVVTTGSDASAQTVLARPAYPVGSGPIILYDTAHMNPPLSEGRYQGVADLLRADGYRVVGGRLSLEPRELAHYHVLMVVTPYAANPREDPISASAPVFSEAECDALEAWVRAGGSLLLVVGHQPSGAATANLARRFDVNLRNGTTYDSIPANNWVAGNRACLGCLKFTRENRLLRPHIIITGRDSSETVGSVISAAGQSLAVGSVDQVLMALSPAAYDVQANGDTVSAAGRAQAVALKHGAGRVVILGDGSILSGFSYGPENPRFRRWWPQDPDSRQFTLNVTHWLTGVLP